MRGLIGRIGRSLRHAPVVALGSLAFASGLSGQGVTTGAMAGLVQADDGRGMRGASVMAVHEPTGTQYGTLVQSGGSFHIPNVRVGGPYTVTVSMLGYGTQTEGEVFIRLGQTVRLGFTLVTEALEVAGIEVVAERGAVMNRDRTGATTFVDPDQVAQLPSVKRSTRDLIRLDPRNDGNYAFAGRNWLYNNISVDGSYFNNAFGLDDPGPGGQAGAEPFPFDAVEQVQVSIAPFDVREGGFTGANVNTVTKSGTNDFRMSAYTFTRDESLTGNKVRGNEVIANPDLVYVQSGFTVSGPLIRDKLFFFVNGEIERRTDPGTSFVASTDGIPGPGESRVEKSVMDAIRRRMIDVYGYDPGPYQDYNHSTDNNKFLAKLDWNINERNNLTVRYNWLDAVRDLPPHGFSLSYNNAGRGPNSTTLPFQNAGYAINNDMHSLAVELNSRGDWYANRFFASYNRSRDARDPFSPDFPTIEIGQDGVGYTTLGHEPFSIHNILDTDILQLTNNFSWFRGDHVITLGANFESYNFFNSFNIFRHGVFFLPYFTGIGSTFSSVDEFFQQTDPSDPMDFRSMVGTGPYKGEIINVGQFSVYAQDEYPLTRNLNVTYGIRLDIPMYFTDPEPNPFSTGLTALDENGKPEVVDQADLPDATPMLSPRVGFNWDVFGDRSTQLRGGTGVFTGRVPFVWVGNVISNPGANPNLWDPFAAPDVEQIRTRKGSILRQSFDLNAMDPDFRWPQVWTTNLAVDRELPWDMLGTLEVLFGKDLNAIYMRNADLRTPIRTLRDGRPYYGGVDNYELNPDGGAGIYVIDNTSEGYNFNVTAQLRKRWEWGLDGTVSYSYTKAENNLKSTEIASVLWQNQPVRGDPNNPEIANSEFSQRHRIVGAATYAHDWNDRFGTQFGLFLEIAEGNQFLYNGGNRYSFIYAGDVNGDGQGGNDLIYIPRNSNDILLDDPSQWAALDAFIRQDDYLSENRGRIAERFAAVNPWYGNVDLRVLQDIRFGEGARSHTFQLSMDILNVMNLLNSDWGVRKVASPAATSPLELVRWQGNEPVFRFNGPTETYVDDPSIFSRWRMQIGAKYMLN